MTFFPKTGARCFCALGLELFLPFPNCLVLIHDTIVFAFQMSVQEFPPNATVMDLLERVGRVNSKWSPYRFPVKEELRPTLNHEPVKDPTLKLKMGDVVHLTPAIPDESLTQYREEIQRMYDRGQRVSGKVATTVAGRRS